VAQRQVEAGRKTNLHHSQRQQTAGHKGLQEARCKVDAQGQKHVQKQAQNGEGKSETESAKEGVSA